MIVEPEDRAYTIFAEAMDRSGFARATLAPREGMEAPVPPRRARPLLTMADMGMDHDMEGMDMPGMQPDTTGVEQGGMPAMPGMGREGHMMPGIDGVLRAPGTLPEEIMHGPDTHGKANAGVPMSTKSRLAEPGVGLGQDGWRVLTYADVEALQAEPELLPPDREIELHLTGNMERFQWSIDGIKSSDAEPIHVTLGERIRLILVNDTMMNHPMHLHGMFMELENGKGTGIPWVDTVNVKPAECASVLFTADVPGPWAFHCHVLYHMNSGMFRVIHVVEPDAPMDHGEE